MKEIRDNKQRLGLLTKDDFGYWGYKDNLLKELDCYIINRKSLHNMQKDIEFGGKTLWSNIKCQGYHPYYLAKELGYKLSDLTNNRPSGYYDDFSNIKEEIDDLINNLGRFPTTIELARVGINGKILKKFGGIAELKKLLSYKDRLMDDNGFKNSSINEFIVAQFLINNKIPFKREQYPFPKEEGQYRSDFTFYFDGKEIHAEIWGFPLSAKSERAIIYNEIRKRKMELYDKHQVELINIESEIFKSTYENITISLQEGFSIILDKCSCLQDTNIQKSLYVNEMDDYEILTFLKNLIPDSEENILPIGKFVQYNYIN
jgi:hypothetical protein